MMVLIGKRALKHIQQIFDWYENEQVQLGYKFIDDIDLTFGTIALFPNAGIKSYAKTRKMMLRKFPFNVYYRVHQKRIIILAVLHQRRNTK
jgi:plasmid stabilization system protein ParE